MAVTTAGLVAFWLLFLGAYLGDLRGHEPCRRRPARAGSRWRAASPSRWCPIAIGYHVAHYLVFLLVQGQYIIPLLSDPVRARLEPVRHRRLPRRYRARRRALCLVRGACRDRCSATSRRSISRTARRSRCLRMPRHRAAIAGAAHRADGGLHLRRSFDHRRADRRAAALPAAPCRPSPNELIAIPEDAVLPDARSGELRRRRYRQERQVEAHLQVLGSAFHDGSKTAQPTCSMPTPSPIVGALARRSSRRP